MIASLRGEVVDLGADYCVIECGGVGHLVTVTGKTASSLVRQEETFLLTTMTVREDAISLFGFKDNVEREMFALLRTVATVGPKVAMNILSVLSPADIAKAVSTKNAKALQAASGVGKRLAERLLVELKDKAEAFAEEPNVAEIQGEQVATGAAYQLDYDLNQVIGALTGLGFDESDAVSAAESVVAADPTLDTSAALRASLKLLGT